MEANIGPPIAHLPIDRLMRIGDALAIWRSIIRVREYAIPCPSRRGYINQMQDEPSGVRRRDLLSLIGAMAGSAAMYHAMTSLGFASESGCHRPIQLRRCEGRLGSDSRRGPCGMTAALDLRNAGYKVKLLEYNARAGGRNWTLRGGDSFTELGGFTQNANSSTGSTSIPARGGFPIIIVRCSITAGGSTSRWNPSSSSITTPICTLRAPSAARRSVSAA